MKKTLLAGILGAAIVLAGCVPLSGMELEYDGKEYEEDRLEEMIEDKLEEQNPGYDLEVDIIEEAE